MVEHFYEMSEQNPLKIRHIEASDRSVAFAALPGYGREWFKTADPAAFSVQEPALRRMRRCFYKFQCDCSAEKLLPFFRSLPPEDLESLYGSDKELFINCPRCGRRFTIKRTQIDRSYYT